MLDGVQDPTDILAEAEGPYVAVLLTEWEFPLSCTSRYAMIYYDVCLFIPADCHDSRTTRLSNRLFTSRWTRFRGGLSSSP